MALMQLLEAVGWTDGRYGAPARFDEVVHYLSAAQRAGLPGVAKRIANTLTRPQKDRLAQIGDLGRLVMPRLPLPPPPHSTCTNVQLDRCGTPQHGLQSDMMALITSDCDAMHN